MDFNNASLKVSVSPVAHGFVAFVHFAPGVLNARPAVRGVACDNVAAAVASALALAVPVVVDVVVPKVYPDYDN